ncbi:OadG family protein [Campylobacter majalis]|uniref:OadG family protein n=1 Tax=Campylobacter majalis TaxID=2790656 RepID=UPI003D68C06B
MDLVSEGLSFTLLGMSCVFLFLTLMVFVLKIQGIVLEKFSNAGINLSEDLPCTNQICQSTNDTELLAAISVAITRYKKSKI